MNEASWPPIDGMMKARLKRQGLGFVSYMMFLLPLYYAVQNNWTDMTMVGVGIYAAYTVFINVVFFLLLRSGASLKFKDPSMTMAQIAIPLATGLVLMRYAGEARPVFLMMFVSTLFFGVFGLTSRQFVGLTLATLIGYIVLIGTKVASTPHTSDYINMQYLQFGALAVMLFWVSLVGGHVGKMRMKMTAQKKALAEAVEKLEKLASHDELTGIYNRRHMLAMMEHERAAFERMGHTFSVCLLDIDFFKKVNDTHGHFVGDEVLKIFAERLHSCTRKMDMLGKPDFKAARDENPASFGRYGGEEFILLMPHTTLAKARVGVDRLRARVMDMPMLTSVGEIYLTLSAGVVEYKKGESPKDTLSRADQALYQAKANGRNRTEVG